MAASLRAAFGQARDRWHIDSGTLKGFYLHTRTNKLYVWEQAAGVLFEFLADNCVPIWTSQDPATNAEIWTVLPLPPTDAAAQMQNVEQGDVLSMQVTVPPGSFPGQQMMVLSPDGQEVQFVVPEGSLPGQAVTISYTRAKDFVMLKMIHEEDKNVNAVEVAEKVKNFAEKWKLVESSRTGGAVDHGSREAEALQVEDAGAGSRSGAETNGVLDRIKKSLSLEGQDYLVTTFTPLGGAQNVEAMIGRYITHLEQTRPWERVSKIRNREDVELKIDSMGAVLGSVLEQLQNRPGVAHAHCQISSGTVTYGGSSSSSSSSGGTTSGSSSSASARAEKQMAQNDKATDLRYFVKDLQTTTGTFLDGERVPAEDPGTKLFDGQILKIGDSSFRVEINYVCHPGEEEQRDARMQRQRDELEKLKMFKQRQRGRGGGAGGGGKSPGAGAAAGGAAKNLHGSSASNGGSTPPGSPGEDDGFVAEDGAGVQRTSKHHGHGAGSSVGRQDEHDLTLDRAAKRRKRHAHLGDTLLDKQREKTLRQLEHREREMQKKENETEFKTAEHQREAGIARDGKFFGMASDTGRSGIGFGVDGESGSAAADRVFPASMHDGQELSYRQQGMWKSKHRLGTTTTEVGAKPEAPSSLSAMFKKAAAAEERETSAATNRTTSSAKAREEPLKYFVKETKNSAAEGGEVADKNDGSDDDSGDEGFMFGGVGLGGAGLGAG